MITQIVFNWFATTDGGEDFDTFRLTDENVSSISLRDRCPDVYVVKLRDGSTEVIYNPNQVSFGPNDEVGGD